MRIISGEFGGRVWHPPKGLPVRPTTDRTKEALFNRLSHAINWEDTSVLDLFAGTGNISLECWSRGAKEVVSVDKHPGCVRAIKEIKARWHISGGKVIRKDVRSFLKGEATPFDLVFMDPPYAMPQQEALVAMIMERWLAPEGTLVVEHAPQVNFRSLPGFDEERKYGSSHLSFFHSTPQP
ncbi:MAG: RsmD family RNA methyltransferase [Bacteroidota bacterium]